MRRMRKKRMKNTILLIALLLILVCGAGGLFYMLRGGIGSEPVMAYSTDREFQHQKISGISQRADAFAADLCVVTGDQTLDSVSLESWILKINPFYMPREPMIKFILQVLRKL